MNIKIEYLTHEQVKELDRKRDGQGFIEGKEDVQATRGVSSHLFSPHLDSKQRYLDYVLADDKFSGSSNNTQSFEEVFIPFQVIGCNNKVENEGGETDLLTPSFKEDHDWIWKFVELEVIG